MASPTHESSTPDLQIHLEPTSPSHSEPLYTEISIPLPRLPSPPRNSTSSLSPPPQTHTRTRGRSLSSLSPFNRARSSSTSTTDRVSEEWPRVRPSILKNREVATAMDLGHQSKRGRSSTVDALAVVPAVLVLSAELFTPGGEEGGVAEGRRKDSGVGRWEEGIR